MKVCIGLLSSILNGTSLDNFSGLFPISFPESWWENLNPGCSVTTSKLNLSVSLACAGFSAKQMDSYSAGGCSTGFSDCFKAPRVLASNRGKVMERRNANPWLEDTSQKVVGLNPRAGKGFFSNEICVQCACMIILFWNFYIIQVWFLENYLFQWT